MRSPLVFILTAEESFTPTRSGAIATHAHACCREAAAAGVEALVLARPHEQAAAYDDVTSVLFPAPAPPRGGATLMCRRAERKLRQWSRLCHGRYVRRTAHELSGRGLGDATLVVHNDPELVVGLRRRLPEARLIHWFHNQHPCKPRPRAAFAHCVDHCVAVSDFIRDWARHAYRLDEAAITRVYNGVDLDLFRPRADAEPNQRVRINFTGRTGVEKAPDVVLEAALRIARRGRAPAFGVQVIGANHWGDRTMDDYQRRLDALAHDLDREGVTVEMTGHLDRRETARRMRDADIHVVPSRWPEPFGLTTVEGMACGLATVGSRTGATPEIFRDRGGVLFRNEDAAGLADVLEGLINEADRRRDLGRRGRRRAECFSWSETWAGLRGVLERAA